MPLLFLIVGLLLIVTAIRGTTGAFASRLWGDVSGSFLTWAAAILIIGGLGEIPTLKEPSRYLLALVVIVILLTKGKGFIPLFIQQIQNPGTATTAQPAGGNPALPSIPVQTQSSGGGGGGGQGGSASSGSNPIGTAASLLPSILPAFGL